MGEFKNKTSGSYQSEAERISSSVDFMIQSTKPDLADQSSLLPKFYQNILKQSLK
jgi:hypothetical protein